MKFDVAEARKYAAEGRIEEWVHDFLTKQAKGNNHAMSLGLKKQKRFWVGPIMVAFSELQRCCGPEPEMEYVEKKENWDKKINQLLTFIKNGWESPPIIATALKGRFSIRDGNHRLEALRQAGFTAYWTIIWFDDEKELKNTRM